MEYWHVNFWKKQFCSIIDVIGSGGYCCKVVIKKNTSVCLLVLLLLSEIAVTRGQTVINTRSVVPVDSGSIFNAGTGSLLITVPAFSGNGGAVLVNAGGTLNHLGNITYQNNSATGSGGAIAVAAGGVLNFSTGTVTFIGNSSVNGGGAIYAAGDLNITGDAVALVWQSGSSLAGAAVYTSGSYTLTGDFVNILANSNTTSASGGAFFGNTGVNEIGRASCRERVFTLV
jgi:predicted outer membrane repeat protein